MINILDRRQLLAAGAAMLGGPVLASSRGELDCSPNTLTQYQLMAKPRNDARRFHAKWRSRNISAMD